MASDCSSLSKKINFNYDQSQHTSDPTLLKLPREVLAKIGGWIATDSIETYAATNAVRWGRVCVLTHHLSHCKEVQEIIQEGDALKKIWALFLEFDFEQNAGIPTSLAKVTTLTEIKAWFDNPNNAVYADSFTKLRGRKINLKAIPPQITKFRKLETLLLSDNMITKIPKCIGELANLEFLLLSNNAISTISDSLGTLSRLQILDLSNNQVAVIPETLGYLPKLKGMFLNGNPVQSEPESLKGIVILQRSSPSELTQSEALLFAAEMGVF